MKALIPMLLVRALRPFWIGCRKIRPGQFLLVRHVPLTPSGAGPTAWLIDGACSFTGFTVEWCIVGGFLEETR